MRGAALLSGPASGEMATHVTVFWKLDSRLSSRPPPTKSHTHSEEPPAVTSSEPASKEGRACEGYMMYVRKTCACLLS